jgi:ligand-binding sensor domain-containing protein
VIAQQPFYRNVKLNDDIQRSTINCVQQDKNGYLWVGTSQGIYRFDGKEFDRIKQPEGSESVNITSIFATNANTLWAGSRGGHIYHVINDSLIEFLPEEGHPAVAVSGFVTDDSGNLWFSTYGEGVYYYNGKSIINLNTDDGLSDNYCYTIVKSADGRIWVATDGGISICQMNGHKKQITIIDNSKGLPDNIVTSLSIDGSTIYCGMQDAGVCLVDAGTLKITLPSATKNWMYGPVSDIVADNGWVWVSVPEKGIISFDSYLTAINGIYVTAEQAPLTRIRDMLADNQHNVWLIQNNRILLSSGNNQLFYNVIDATNCNNIHSILSDKSLLWFSNNEGLFRFDTRSGKVQKISIPSKGGNHIICLYKDVYENIWAGTFGSGMYCVSNDGKHIEQFGETNGLSNGNILSITGRGNHLWLATLGGAYHCTLQGDAFLTNSKQVFERVSGSDFQGTYYIYSVFVDSQNRVWFGTDGDGITVLERGVFKKFDKNDGLLSNIVYSITEDSDHKIWFSTATSGIYCYDGKELKNFGLSSGLSDLSITALIADKNHHLIIVNNEGVDVLDTRTGELIYFGEANGLSGLNPDLNTCVSGMNGTVWIGSQKGIFNLSIPTDIRAMQPRLQVSLQPGMIKYFANNRYVLAYNNNYLSFYINALYFINPDQLNYQVQLEGYDRDWVNTRDNQVTYPNLPPGEYTFRVRTSLSRNFNSSSESAIRIIIQKPFWRTHFFIIAAVLLATGLVLLIIRLRDNANRKRQVLEKEKLMFQFQTLRSQVNPHFLFNSFSTLISIIDEDKEIAIEYVEKLSRFFRDILEHRDKELIMVDEELELIHTYYFLQQKRYGNSLQLTITIGDEIKKTLIPPMVLQMLVENAIKHNIVSADAPLVVAIDSSNRFIKVSNNLQAKKNSTPSTGIGLNNIKHRYQMLHHSNVEINSSSSRFEVLLPVIYPEP